MNERLNEYYNLLQNTTSFFSVYLAASQMPYKTSDAANIKNLFDNNAKNYNLLIYLVSSPSCFGIFYKQCYFLQSAVFSIYLIA